MHGLIASDEPSPFGVYRPARPGPFLLTVDHAGNRVPRVLGDLGVAQQDRDRHIGIDIGILGVAEGLSRALSATLLFQPYSRLVIDCNRHPGQADSMPEISDGTIIPANRNLQPAQRLARESAIFWPYHAGIAAELDTRVAARQHTVLIALHSFTPRHGDYPAPRPWHIGVLWNRDARLANALLAELQAEGDLVVGINEPYGVNDAIDYAVPVHAEARGLIHVELEIRQDLIGDAAGQAAWAKRLAVLLPRALSQVERAGNALNHG